MTPALSALVKGDLVTVLDRGGIPVAIREVRGVIHGGAIVSVTAGAYIDHYNCADGRLHDAGCDGPSATIRPHEPGDEQRVSAGVAVREATRRWERTKRLLVPAEAEEREAAQALADARAKLEGIGT